MARWKLAWQGAALDQQTRQRHFPQRGGKASRRRSVIRETGSIEPRRVAALGETHRAYCMGGKVDFENEFPKRSHEDVEARMKSLEEASPAEKFARFVGAGRRWPCEERIQPGLDAWEATMGPAYVPRHKRLLKHLFAGMRIVMEEVGEEQQADFIRWAVATMRERGLTVAEVWSLHWLFGEYREQGDAHDEWSRRRYLEGRLASDD